jgi:predicted RNase H-like HicB family nuclease
MTLFVVRAEWDPAANVWVADSADVPGLVAEADSIENLRPKLIAMISDLVQENDMDIDGADISVHIIAHTADKIPNPKAA